MAHQALIWKESGNAPEWIGSKIDKRRLDSHPASHKTRQKGSFLSGRFRLGREGRRRMARRRKKKEEPEMAKKIWSIVLDL